MWIKIRKVIVYEKDEKIIVEAFNNVYDTMEEKNIDMGTAAHLIAINRISDAMKTRGWY